MHLSKSTRQLCEECATPLCSRLQYMEKAGEGMIQTLWFCPKCHPVILRREAKGKNLITGL